jgi:hypothetical protein
MEQVRFPRPAGMPVPGDPGLHLEGHYDPPARSWLIQGSQMNPLRSVARERQMPQQSAERRAGLRHWPVISGGFRRWVRPRGGPPGAAASAPAPVGALHPSLFGKQKQTKGHPDPHPNRAITLGCLTSE